MTDIVPELRDEYFATGNPLLKEAADEIETLRQQADDWRSGNVPQQDGEQMMYLIWSNEHRSWWRPNSRGYTLYAEQAGVYSFEEARGISWQGRDGWFENGVVPDELMVPLDGIPEYYRPQTKSSEEQP